MALNPSVAALPEYVAEDKGFFAKNGVDVKISDLTNLSTIPSVVGHQYDFGMSVQPILFAAVSHGLPLVVTAGGLYGTADQPNGVVLVRKDSTIKTGAQLAGKTIGVPTVNGNFADCVVVWLKSKGVDPNSVKLRQVAFPNMTDQLNANKIDAAFSIHPFDVAALGAGQISLGQPCLAISPTSQGTFLISNSAWARAHSQTVDAVRRSLTEAIAWMKTNTAGWKAILAKHTGVPESRFTSLELSAFNTTVPVSDLEAWMAALKGLGKLPEGLPSAATLIFGGS